MEQQQPMAPQGQTADPMKQLSTMAETLRVAIWGPMSDMILEELEGAENFNETAGEIAAFVMREALDGAKKIGKKIDMSIMPEVGSEVVNEIYGMAAKAGIYEPKDDAQAQKDQGAAMSVAADFLAKKSQGLNEFDPQHVKTFMDQAMSGQMDEEGTEDGA